MRTHVKKYLLEIQFMYLGNKEMYLMCKVHSLISVSFSTSMCERQGHDNVLPGRGYHIVQRAVVSQYGAKQSDLSEGNWRHSGENSSCIVLSCIWQCNSGLNLCLYRKKWRCNHLYCGTVIAWALFMKPVTLFFATQYTNIPKLHLLGLEVFQLWRVLAHFSNKNYTVQNFKVTSVKYNWWKFRKEIFTKLYTDCYYKVGVD
jgi:hypothetical protein